MYIEYVTVNRVIERNNSLEGTKFKLYNNSEGFYCETDDVYKRIISRLPALGYSENNYPEYYKRCIQYKSYLNLLKANYQHLICVDSYNTNGEDYFFISYTLFPYFDMTNSHSISVSNGLNRKYSDYFDNEIFARNKKYIDGYNEFKKEIFAYYNINR